VTQVVEHQSRERCTPCHAREHMPRRANRKRRSALHLNLDLLDGLLRRLISLLDEAAGQIGQLARALSIGITRGDETARGVEQDSGVDVRGGVDEAPDVHRGQNSRVPLARISWIAAVAICVVAAALLLISGYSGYAGVLVAVGAAAAVNLL
jgi:hypothetical protein